MCSAVCPSRGARPNELGSQVPAGAVGRQPRGDLEHKGSEFKQPLGDVVALHSLFSVFCFLLTS